MFIANGYLLSLVFYMLVKALPRVCMKNTGSVECCIYHETPPSAVFHTHKHTTLGSALNGILYLTTVN